MRYKLTEKKACYIMTAVVQFTITFCLLSMLKCAILEVSFIPSESMRPTLTEGSVVVGIKSNRNIKYDDLVIFYPNTSDGTTQYLKRVVGLPGDIIEIRDGSLYRNGMKITSSYTAETTIKYEMPSMIVPDAEYFVLGDNRNNSEDSHILGAIAENQIAARVIYYIRYKA